MKLVIILFLALLFAGAVECALHLARLKRIPVRILVNGTRGKTSVTRLTAAALRASGLKTYAKCTGTEAMMILPDGSEQPIERPHGSRLTEQIPFIRRAVKDGAQAVVIECMAVHPESQEIMAQKLVRPTLTLITNARVDHVDEIGATEAETLRSLCFSLTKDTVVITAEPGIEQYAKNVRRPGDAPIAADYLKQFSYPVFIENLNLVLAVADALGIDRQTALDGMLTAQPDIGMTGPYFLGECTVVNAFAANDCRSTRQLFEQSASELDLHKLPVQLIYNNRSDREYRLSEFVPFLKDMKGKCGRLYVIGENAAKVQRFFARRTGLDCAAAPGGVDELKPLFEERQALFCFGNTKGAGKEFLEYCKEHGRG